MSFMILLIGVETAAVAVLIVLAWTRGAHRMILPALFAMSVASACSLGLAIEGLLRVILLGSDVRLLVPLGWCLAGLGGLAVVVWMRAPLWLIAAPAALVMPVILFTLFDVDSAIAFTGLAVAWLAFGLACWRRLATSVRSGKA